MQDNRPKVGIGVIIIKNSKILLGKRKEEGPSTWAPPGGHLEFKETPEQCAQREVLEETGLEITNLSVVAATNDIFEHANKHYITLFVTADYVQGEPQVLEPDKCYEWRWFSWDNLPEPLFTSFKNYLTQKNYYNLLKNNIEYKTI